jgi:GntR family transcriptional regulator, transcriptional repressor for pyruvate dehydrogenase complex
MKRLWSENKIWSDGSTTISLKVSRNISDVSNQTYGMAVGPVTQSLKFGGSTHCQSFCIPRVSVTGRIEKELAVPNGLLYGGHTSGPETPPLVPTIGCHNELSEDFLTLLLMHGECSMYKTVQTSRLYEQIVQQIEDSIQKGALKAGDQLPAERELALQFGVSRTAVREAVKALHEKGLIEAYPGRGTFVTSERANSIRLTFDRMFKARQADGTLHLVEVREILEPEIAALAAVRADEESVSELREAVSIMDNARHDPDAFIEADLDFHLALAEAASNPLILSLIDSIIGVLREQRMRIFQVDGGPERGQYHHKRILEAIENRDSVGAREAMRAHLRQVREDSGSATLQHE